MVLGFKSLAIGFFTITVEKAASFQAETIVQFWTSELDSGLAQECKILMLRAFAS